jgi:glycerate kinase
MMPLRRILIAPDKFKGSLTSSEVCRAIETGLRRAADTSTLVIAPSTEIISLPLADGGDGLLDIIAYYTGGVMHLETVKDPLGRAIKSGWLLSKDGRTAFVEMAKASGLDLLNPAEYDCLHTTTFGTGELIGAAIRSGAREIVIGIGGSATNDGGMGMAAALGYRFLDCEGKELSPVGASLIKVARIHRFLPAGIWPGIRFRVAVDVKNPLIGPQGATRIYAPQKGADPLTVELLEVGMRNFSAVLKTDLGMDLADVEGAGAAGGLGAGCMAFLHAAPVRGVDLAFEYADAVRQIQAADIVITGEGKIDRQTLQGKLVAAIAQLGRQYGRRVFAVCGKLELSAEELRGMGVEAAFSIIGGIARAGEKDPESYAMQNAAELLDEIGFGLGLLLKD